MARRNASTDSLDMHRLLADKTASEALKHQRVKTKEPSCGSQNVWYVHTLAHPHLRGESFELKLQAGINFGHDLSHALNRLHLVRGESATAFASAQGHQSGAVLVKADVSQRHVMWVDRGRESM